MLRVVGENSDEAKEPPKNKAKYVIIVLKSGSSIGIFVKDSVALDINNKFCNDDPKAFSVKGFDLEIYDNGEKETINSEVIIKPSEISLLKILDSEELIME